MWWQIAEPLPKTMLGSTHTLDLDVTWLCVFEAAPHCVLMRLVCVCFGVCTVRVYAFARKNLLVVEKHSEFHTRAL